MEQYTISEYTFSFYFYENIPESYVLYFYFKLTGIFFILFFKECSLFFDCSLKNIPSIVLHFNEIIPFIIFTK